MGVRQRLTNLDAGADRRLPRWLQWQAPRPNRGDWWALAAIVVVVMAAVLVAQAFLPDDAGPLLVGGGVLLIFAAWSFVRVRRHR